MASRKKLSLTGIIVVFVIYAAYALSSNNATGTITSKSYSLEESIVTKVVDGDTVVIEGGQRVRLLNIDTRERGENCYTEAKKRLEELILLKNITLERDKENTDRYDRLLRHIFINNTNINLQMVKEGLAVVYIYEPNVKYRQEFTEAEKLASTESGCVWTKLPK